jgi:D-alanyl-D-alanine carboxypeptidase (penicillin-binding protein 5/6)
MQLPIKLIQRGFSMTFSAITLFVLFFHGVLIIGKRLRIRSYNFIFPLVILFCFATNVLAAVTVSSGSAVGSVTAFQERSIKPVPAPSVPRPNLETSARQVLLVDFITGDVLLEKNADESMYPSSMTKVMTAILVFEKLKAGHIQLDTHLPVSERAWRMEGSKMFVPLNGMVSVEDLLKGIIIQSGNDACIVMAEGVSGTEEKFAEEMTEYAHKLGALNTTFKNASGWPDPDHLTTARDLVTISRYLLTNYPESYSLFSIKDFAYNKIRQWNRNALLYKNISCDGIKTGYTKAGGYGMIASQVQAERRLILVVNGLESEQARTREALKLLDWGMQTFNNYTLFKAGEQVEMIPVWLGDKNHVPATVGQDIILTLPKMTQKNLKVEIHYNTPLSSPIKKNDIIGKVVMTFPSWNEPVERPLLAAESINKGSFFKRIKDSFRYLIWG